MIRYFFFNRKIHKFNTVLISDLERRQDKTVMDNLEFPVKHFPIGWSGRVLTEDVAKVSDKRPQVILFDNHFQSDSRNPTSKWLAVSEFCLSKRDLIRVMHTMNIYDDVKKATSFWNEIGLNDNIILHVPHNVQKHLGASYRETFEGEVNQFLNNQYTDEGKRRVADFEECIEGTRLMLGKNYYGYRYLQMRDDENRRRNNDCMVFVKELYIDIDKAPVFSSKQLQEIYDNKFEKASITLDEALTFIETYKNAYNDDATRNVLLTSLLNLDWRNTIDYILHLTNQCYIRKDKRIQDKFVSIGLTRMEWGANDPSSIVSFCVSNNIEVHEDFYQKIVRPHELGDIVRNVGYHLSEPYRTRFFDEFINNIELVKNEND